MPNNQAEELKKKLFKNKENGWNEVDENIREEIFSYAKGYIEYLNNSKTESEIIKSSNKIAEENLNKIWGRFYKEDSSRNRTDGGTGIGLALVKAIMTNYKNDYGVINKENGVEFYFELDKGKVED